MAATLSNSPQESCSHEADSATTQGRNGERLGRLTNYDVIGDVHGHADCLRHTETGGRHLRPRITKNVEQHAAVIAAVGLGLTFRDQGDHLRHCVRLQWWDDSATNWRDLLPPGTPIFDSSDNRVEALPDEPIPSHLSKRYTGDIPVIFGQYWFEAPLQVMNPLALCVDHSAGAGGPLAPYRFEGEPTLSADNLVSF